MKIWKAISQVEKEIGEALKTMRLDLQMTQEQLASDLGISRTFLASCEAGKLQYSRFQLFELFQVYREKKGNEELVTLYEPRLRRLYKKCKMQRACRSIDRRFDELIRS